MSRRCPIQGIRAVHRLLAIVLDRSASKDMLTPRSATANYIVNGRCIFSINAGCNAFEAACALDTAD
jgi:hypothetical protein